MAELEVGDAVRLKAGGPVMTVDSVSGEGCHCVWFVNNEERLGYYSSEALQKVSIPPRGDKAIT